MSFRSGDEKLDGLITKTLERVRKQENRTAELLRDQNALSGTLQATIDAAISDATDLVAGYIYRSSAAAALADATSTLLSWQAEERNDDEAWSSSSNPSRVTPRPGVYEFWGQWTSNAVAHTDLEADLRMGAAGVAGAGTAVSVSRTARNAGRGTCQFSTAPIDIDEGDYIEVFVLVRGSAGAVTPLGTIEETWMAWKKVG